MGFPNFEVQIKMNSFRFQALGQKIKRSIKSVWWSEQKILDFGSRHASIEMRDKLVSNYLPKPPGWVLDVGSNLGKTSNLLASHGHYVLGVECKHQEWARSCARARPGAAFMNKSVTPEMIKSSKGWDAILLLSVLHRIYAYEGPDSMIAVLAACGQRTNNILIEGSTRHARYANKKQLVPEFVDHDLESAKEWHRDIFRSALDSAWEEKHVEMLSCSSSEPYRLFFCLRRP